MTTKDESVTKMQVSDLGTNMEIEDNNSLGGRNPYQIPMTSEDSDTCDTDEQND